MSEDASNSPAPDLSASSAEGEGSAGDEGLSGNAVEAAEPAPAQSGDASPVEDTSGPVEPPAESAVARPAARLRPGRAGAARPSKSPADDKFPADFGWYILHTLSGNEEKVRQTMITTLNREGLSDCMQDVLIPVEDVVEVKRGKKHIKKRKLFPGYVFVRMKATEPVLKQIRRLPNLARFVGGIGGSGPVPVTDAEIGRIRVFMTETKEKPKIIYEVGETVRIINGPFMDFNGTILEMDVDRGRLKIQVEIFGRATPVDLDFDQVEKV